MRWTVPSEEPLYTDEWLDTRLAALAPEVAARKV